MGTGACPGSPLCLTDVYIFAEIPKVVNSLCTIIVVWEPGQGKISFYSYKTIIPKGDKVRVDQELVSGPTLGDIWMNLFKSGAGLNSNEMHNWTSGALVFEPESPCTAKTNTLSQPQRLPYAIASQTPKLFSYSNIWVFVGLSLHWTSIVCVTAYPAKKKILCILVFSSRNRNFHHNCCQTPCCATKSRPSQRIFHVKHPVV